MVYLREDVPVGNGLLPGAGFTSQSVPVGPTRPDKGQQFDVWTDKISLILLHRFGRVCDTWSGNGKEIPDFVGKSMKNIRRWGSVRG